MKQNAHQEISNLERNVS